MFPDWLWQGITLWAITAALGAAAFALLKHYKEEWSAPIMYGLGALALVIIIAVGIRGLTTPKPPAPTSADNVEQRVHDWLDEFGLKIILVAPSAPDLYFGFDVETPNQTRIFVYRKKLQHGNDMFLAFEENVGFGPEQEACIQKIPGEKMAETYNQVLLELVRLNVSVNMLRENNQFKFRVIKLVPITANITDYTLITNLNEVEDAGTAANQVVVLNLPTCFNKGIGGSPRPTH
jgi:hypothetical protein